jgi:hypothetical protein
MEQEMSNPQPTGTGEQRGLEDAQQAGTPLPGRTARSEANDAQYKIRPDCADTTRAASADTSLEVDPWSRF